MTETTNKFDQFIRQGWRYIPDTSTWSGGVWYHEQLGSVNNGGGTFEHIDAAVAAMERFLHSLGMLRVPEDFPADQDMRCPRCGSSKAREINNFRCDWQCMTCGYVTDAEAFVNAGKWPCEMCGDPAECIVTVDLSGEHDYADMSICTECEIGVAIQHTLYESQFTTSVGVISEDKEAVTS